MVLISFLHYSCSYAHISISILSCLSHFYSCYSSFCSYFYFILNLTFTCVCIILLLLYPHLVLCSYFINVDFILLCVVFLCNIFNVCMLLVVGLSFSSLSLLFYTSTLASGYQNHNVIHRYRSYVCSFLTSIYSFMGFIILSFRHSVTHSFFHSLGHRVDHLRLQMSVMMMSYHHPMIDWYPAPFTL